MELENYSTAELRDELARRDVASGGTLTELNAWRELAVECPHLTVGRILLLIEELKDAGRQASAL